MGDDMHTIANRRNGGTSVEFGSVGTGDRIVRNKANWA